MIPLIKFILGTLSYKYKYTSNQYDKISSIRAQIVQVHMNFPGSDCFQGTYTNRYLRRLVGIHDWFLCSVLEGTDTNQSDLNWEMKPSQLGDTDVKKMMVIQA